MLTPSSAPVSAPETATASAAAVDGEAHVVIGLLCVVVQRVVSHVFALEWWIDGF